MKKILILLSIFLLTGCYNYRELNDLAIISAFGIDKTDDEFLVTVQIVDTNKTGSDTTTNGDYPKTIIYEQTGKTIQEALRLMILDSPRRLYAEHTRLLLISEDIAKNELKNIIDFFYRDPESRKEYQVAVVKNTSANKILKTLTPLDTIGADNIVNSIESNNAYLGELIAVTFNDLLEMYLNPRIEISMPALQLLDMSSKDDTDQLKESDANNKIKLDGIAVFKDNALVGYLTIDESLTLNFIKNKVENTIISHTCEPKKHIVYEIMNTTTNVSASSTEKSINIDIKGNATIAEINCNYKLTKPQDIIKIEKKLNQEIEKTITKNIKSINQKFHSDIFGFKDLYYRSNYQFYQTIKDNWNETIEDIKINVKSKVKITEKGNGLKVITNE